MDGVGLELEVAVWCLRVDLPTDASWTRQGGGDMDGVVSEFKWPYDVDGVGTCMGWYQNLSVHMMWMGWDQSLSG